MGLSLRHCWFLLLILCVLDAGVCAERVNHEGRILGPAPVVTNTVVFNTAQADTIVSAMQVFPVTSAWNEDISARPLLSNSDAMIAQIIADLATNRRTLRVFQEMNFVLVPDNQPASPITFMLYGDESDPSPYPIATNMPVEGWPSQTSTNSLFQWQQDTNNLGGDRHAIIVQPGKGFIWEMWQAKLRTNGTWEASNGAKFDLASNTLRPLGWTSGDAAGLPMFGALPRYDEGVRGTVEHACRIVVARSRREYIYPATHWASTTAASQVNVPAMGQRLRLKSSFVIPAAWSKEEKAILVALKKYGAIVADNGGFFSISITPDNRWPANAFSHISSIGITNFEVIQTSGPTEGPRSPGAPTASAGPDQSVALGVPTMLQGFVSSTGAPPVVQWKLYSGPGTATFGNTGATNTTVNFSAAGVYTLMLSGDDHIHAVAYDAVIVTVTQAINLTITRAGTNVVLNWTGGGPPYTVQRMEALHGSWTNVISTNGQSLRLPISGTAACFRVSGQ